MREPFDEAVHLWSVGLDQPDSALSRYRATLDAGERQRASGFTHERLRRRFIVSHGALRMELAAWLDVSPASLRFDTAGDGKPRIRYPRVGAPPQFNMSHSDELALIAIAPSVEVGVDVERVRPVTDWLAIARRYFTAEEVQTLRTLPEAERDELFLVYWTQKEACVKLGRRGLNEAWSSLVLRPEPGYVATVIATGARR